jgi:hypothetical protein
VIALSLGGLRRKVEAVMLPDAPIILLNLDRAARLERDRRRLTGRPRRSALAPRSSSPATAAGSNALVPHGEPGTVPRPGRGVRGEGRDGS